MSKKEILELLDILEKAQAQKLSRDDFGVVVTKINFGFLKDCVREYRVDIINRTIKETKQ